MKQHPFVYVHDRPSKNGNCSDLNHDNKYYVECSGKVFDGHEEHSKEEGIHCCSGMKLFISFFF